MCEISLNSHLLVIFAQPKRYVRNRFDLLLIIRKWDIKIQLSTKDALQARCKLKILAESWTISGDIKKFVFRPGVTNLFAIAGHFVSYRWVSGPHNFVVIHSGYQLLISHRKD